MIKKLLKRFGYVPELIQVPVIDKPKQKVHYLDEMFDNTHSTLEEAWDRNFKNSVHPSIVMDSKEKPSFAMDNNLNIKAPYQNNFILPEAQVLWYANQTFIGYQLCSLIAQQWLVSKACLMPAKDATRNGYELTVNDGNEIAPEVLDDIRRQDVAYRVNYNLIQFVQFGRIFGIRICMFIVESDDPDYYRNPFNIDGVLPGTYKGMSQVDPYWITPQLSPESSGNPAAIDFYEPTWWVINGRPIHRTHLVIFRTEEVSDILKPTYIFGGIPIPQKIAQRVYAAEITANEAPKLAITKRTDVINVDTTEAESNNVNFAERMSKFAAFRDNFGIKVLGLDESMNQFDTSLTDLDAVIMTQYQLVAAASNVPAVKLMGTPPKGFNSTGEFEEASYHEELESIQSHDLTPLLNRHHMLLIKSEIAPKYNIEPFETTIIWNDMDSMTAKEQAELNRFKAETGEKLIMNGAIDGMEERERIIADPKSGYSGITNDKMDNDTEFELNDLTGA